jgi:phenylalanyl-tRNA synthetase beta chain
MCLPANDARRQVTRLLNPLTEDQAVMRSMLLPGLLENVQRNINHQQPDLRLFEVGKTFIQESTDGQPEERYQLCAVCSGLRYPGSSPLYFSEQAADIFDIKGLAETLISTLRLKGEHDALHFLSAPEDCQPYAEPSNFMILLDDTVEIGRAGQLKADILLAMGMKQPVFFLECDLELLRGLPVIPKQFEPIAKYPKVKRDIALLVPEQVPAGELLSTIKKQRADLVESIDLFDVYSGKPIEAGMKSVALSVTYRSAKKTLDDVTVDKIHEKIVNTLMSAFNGRYREGT